MDLHLHLLGPWVWISPDSSRLASRLEFLRFATKGVGIGLGLDGDAGSGMDGDDEVIYLGYRGVFWGGLFAF
jgi:hypothetical protein